MNIPINQKKLSAEYMDNYKNNLFLNATPKIFDNAGELRKGLTSAEQILWEVLRGRRLL